MPIDSKTVDRFGQQLSAELSALMPDERNALLIKVGRMEMRMRADGQYPPVWRGPAPEAEMLGRDVVVPTPMGDQRGRVMCFGLVNTGQEYERSVFVRVPASGTQHEAPGSSIRLASPDDSARIENEIVMAERLTKATAVVGPKVRSRSIRDPALSARLLELVHASPNVVSVHEGPVNFKVVGRDRSRRLYLFKSQVRVDVSGFSLPVPGVRQISEREARDMHLGSVRGQIDFSDRVLGEAAFVAALAALA